LGDYEGNVQVSVAKGSFSCYYVTGVIV